MSFLTINLTQFGPVVSLDRFPDPVEEKPVGKCDWCKLEMYAGEEAVNYEGYTFCAKDCMMEHMSKEGHYWTVTLE